MPQHPSSWSIRCLSRPTALNQLPCLIFQRRLCASMRAHFLENEHQDLHIRFTRKRYNITMDLCNPVSKSASMFIITHLQGHTRPIFAFQLQHRHHPLNTTLVHFNMTYFTKSSISAINGFAFFRHWARSRSYTARQGRTVA
jgi:hypothetical protein